MKRFACFPLIIAALVAVVILPLGGVQAESIDQLRQKALDELKRVINNSAPGIRTFAYKRLFSGGEFERVGSNTIENIGCTKAPENAPIFELRLREKDSQKSASISITVPQDSVTMPLTWDSTQAVSVKPSQRIRVRIRQKSGEELLYLPNGNFFADVATNGDDNSDKIIDELAFIVTPDGDRDRTTRYIEGINLPFSQETLPNAKVLCKAKSADEIQTILKRIQDGVK